MRVYLFWEIFGKGRVYTKRKLFRRWTKNWIEFGTTYAHYLLSIGWDHNVFYSLEFEKSWIEFRIWSLLLT